eukprot:2650095-Rhodomonas_salina.1
MNHCIHWHWGSASVQFERLILPVHRGEGQIRIHGVVCDKDAVTHDSSGGKRWLRDQVFKDADDCSSSTSCYRQHAATLTVCASLRGGTLPEIVSQPQACDIAKKVVPPVERRGLGARDSEPGSTCRAGSRVESGEWDLRFKPRDLESRSQSEDQCWVSGSAVKETGYGSGPSVSGGGLRATGAGPGGGVEGIRSGVEPTWWRRAKDTARRLEAGMNGGGCRRGGEGGGGDRKARRGAEWKRVKVKESQSERG